MSTTGTNTTGTNNTGVNDHEKKNNSTQDIINSGYGDQIGVLNESIKDLEERRKAVQQSDETAQRKARNFAWIAQLSDGIASIANLIGTANGAANMNLGQGASSVFGQRIEAARKERQADIKSIDDRLNQARQQLAQMQMAKTNALASANESQIGRDFQSSEADKSRKFTTSERLASQEFTKGMNEINFKQNKELKELDNKGAVELAIAKIEATAKAKKDAEESERKVKEAENKSKDDAHFLLKDEETGKYMRYDATKAERAAIMEKFAEAMDNDIQTRTETTTLPDGTTVEQVVVDTSTPLGKAYQEYLDVSKRSTSTEQQKEAALMKVIGLSPTMRDLITRGTKGRSINAEDQVEKLLNDNLVQY